MNNCQRAAWIEGTDRELGFKGVCHLYWNNWVAPGRLLFFLTSISIIYYLPDVI